MIARRLILTSLASLCALCGGFVLAGASAQAEVIHNYLSQITEVPASSGAPLPGHVQFMESMTVSAGHLWIAENSSGFSGFRVDEFGASTGAFVSQIVPPESFSENKGEGVAVGEGEVYVGGFASGVPAVAVFSEGGTPQATWTGAAAPGGFGELVGDVAVDNSANPLDKAKGDVFVAVPSQHAIDVFHPEAGGKEPSKLVTQLTGISPSEPFGFPYRMAVDEANGDLIVLDVGARTVDVFEPTVFGEYAFVRKITGPPSGSFKGMENLAVDSGTGELYVTDGFNPAVIDEFSSATGAYLGHITGVGSPGGNIRAVASLAVDPVSHDVFIGDDGNSAVKVFGPDLVVPDVTTGPVSSPRARNVTLTGTVNPDKAGAATCQFVWGATTEFGHTASCSKPVAEGESPVAVEAQLGGLEPDTSYCDRLQATNGNGTNPGEVSQDQCFTTPGPGLHAEAVSAVTAESVTFEATINPNKALTTYYVQYGATSAYGTDAPAAPGAVVGSGEGGVEVSQHVQKLEADTVYHYRVVAVSEVAGKVEEFVGPDQTFTTQHSGSAFVLPEGRQYEMVSPPQKQGSLFKSIFSEFSENPTIAQASASGNAFVDEADQPTEPESQGDANGVSVFMARGPGGGWSSRVISAPHNEATGVALGQGGEYRLFSEDLSRAFVQQLGNFTPLSPEAVESTPYLRTNYLNGDVSELCNGSYRSQSTCFEPLVTRGDTAPGTVFGDTIEGECFFGLCGPLLVAATPDFSHIVLKSRRRLTSTPVNTGKFEQLPSAAADYEWYGGRLQLLNILPGQEEGGAAAVARGDEKHVISRDGGRVFLEAYNKARLPFTEPVGLYLRDVARGETVQLDAAEPGCGACGGSGGVYMTANSEGSRVFFIDPNKLTRDSGAAGYERRDLYECEIVEVAGKDKCNLSDLTPETDGEAKVQVVLGASEDGSYVYFVAGGALAPGAIGEKACTNRGGLESTGTCNLYVSHKGVTRFIAKLSNQDTRYYSRDALNQALPNLHARVSPDGRWLAFMSDGGLTGYDSRDAVSGSPDEEVYLYSASSNALACASCDPTGARPVGYVVIQGSSSGSNVASIIPGWGQYTIAASISSGSVYQPRYLSDSGRLFFDSKDALVPLDVNGAVDVYEYEPQGMPAGEHACGSASGSGSQVFKPAHGFEVEGRKGEEPAGCVALISAGNSPEESTFLDASETGGDVFFLTASKLAPQDFDHAYDIYDAQECTSAVPCLPVAAEQPPPCATEGSCRAASAPQPSIYGAPSSATFNGTGNLTQTSPPAIAPNIKKATRCRKGFVKRKRRCVKAKSKRAKRASRAGNKRRSK